MKIGQELRKDFPILSRKINGKALVYLDSAATSQKPKQAIEAILDFYTKHNANIHRSVYQLAEEATEMYEKVRDKAAKFIGAKSSEEIVFTKGATESINLVAYSWGEENIKKGDNIVTTIMEHHSNFVPWQQLCKRKGAKLRTAPITRDGRLDLKKLYSLVDGKTKLVTFTHASNMLGTINPVEQIIKKLQGLGFRLRVLVDGAQAAPHLPVNVQKLGCDFYVFSGHKMLGPTGVGVLYAKKEILEQMPPFLTGGHMIRKVTTKDSIWNDVPLKFEAGTANIAQVIGLGAAIDYLNKFGMDNVRKHETVLTDYALLKLRSLDGIEIYGPERVADRVGVISFNIKGLHSHDLATFLDQEGIAIRAGHHCTMPLHREALGIEASARISFYIYNNKKEIDFLLKSLKKAKEILSQ